MGFLYLMVSADRQPKTTIDRKKSTTTLILFLPQKAVFVQHMATIHHMATVYESEMRRCMFSTYSIRSEQRSVS